MSKGLSQQQVIAAISKGHQHISELPNVVRFAMIGSAIFMPAPMDVDFLILVKADDAATYIDKTKGISDWQTCSDYDKSTTVCRWAAIRSADLNFIITVDAGFFKRYVLAMEVCAALKLADKTSRVTVCKMIRDGWRDKVHVNVTEMLDDEL